MSLRQRPELDQTATEAARSAKVLDRVRQADREVREGRPDPLAAELAQQQRPEAGTPFYALLQIWAGRSDRLPPAAGDWLALDGALDAAEAAIATYDPAREAWLKTAAECQAALDRVTWCLENIGASPALATLPSISSGVPLSDPRARQPVDLLREYRTMLQRVLKGINYNAQLAAAKAEQVTV
jgi:hypothetical protein